MSFAARQCISESVFYYSLLIYFTRPDFISLDMHCKNWASYRLMTKNLTQFGWTFRSAAVFGPIARS